MLSLEHYNEEIARLVSALQIETGKSFLPFSTPRLLNHPFSSIFRGRKKSYGVGFR